MTHPHLRAMTYALAGFAIWSVGDSFTKLLGQANFPPWQIIVISGLFCSLTIAGVTVARGNAKALKPNNVKLELVRSFIYAIQQLINVYCFTNWPLTTVYIALFTTPMLVALIAAGWLRETLSWKQALAIIVGFGGVLLAFLPGQTGATPSGNLMLIALIAFPILGSVSVVFVRFMGRTETSESMSLFPTLVRIPLLLPLCLFGLQPVTLINGMAFAGIGFCGGIGLLLMMSALKKAPAGIVHSFHYSLLIWGALFGYLIWHDIPSLQLIAGGGVIIASGLYMVWQGTQQQKIKADKIEAVL
jgi:drug/metabolite transporter (DMT)-like permease